VTKAGLLAVLAVAAAVLGLSCKGEAERQAQETRGAKNVILLIGDGFGPAQMALGMYYAQEVEGRELSLQGLMEKGMTGYTLNMSGESMVTDSAASGTQIATGIRTRNEMIGLDDQGRDSETILEWAEERGLVSGLVTNTRITHATPASFAAHVISRYSPEQDIADQVIGEHEVEVLLAGGARACVPQGSKVSDVLPAIPPELDGSSRRSDDRNLVAEARDRGYTIADDRASLKAGAAEASKLLGLFSASHFPYVVDREALTLDGVPRLQELTEAALAVLSRSSKGFFLMVEGGRIDHAAHDNDAGAMIHEILEFDRALEVALRFQASHPDTLILVTADHATGGFSFTSSARSQPFEQKLPSGKIYRPRWYTPEKGKLALLGRQTASYELILERAGDDPARVIQEVERDTGLVITMEEAQEVLARNAEGLPFIEGFSHLNTEEEDVTQCLLGRVLARQTSVVWSTGGHSTDPILTFGSGPGAEELRGVYPNTHIFEIMKKALEN
jgi:alkaline phosphatase